MLAQSLLVKDDEIAALDPFLVVRDETRPGHRAAAVSLTALHREVHLAAARVAGDDAIPEAEKIAQDVRDDDAFGADAGAADDDILLGGPQVLPDLHVLA